MKVIQQFTANLLSYIPTKYYWPTFDLIIVKTKRVNFIRTRRMLNFLYGISALPTKGCKTTWNNF